MDCAGLVRCDEDASGRRSRMFGSRPISSKLRPGGFDELIPKTLAAATVDRQLRRRDRSSF
jgi:hypothetical protein